MNLILSIRKVEADGLLCYFASLQNGTDVICNYYFNRYEQTNGHLRLYKGGILLASFDVSLLTINYSNK